MKDQRDAVFTRIKEALRVPAPHRHPAAHGHPAGNGAPGQTSDDGLPCLASFRSWLPSVGGSYAEQLRLFSQNSAQLKTELIIAKSAVEISQSIFKLSQEGKWKRMASHRLPENALLTDVQKQLALDFVGEPMLFTEKGYEVAALESVDASITGCEALIAQTGSVLVTNPSSGGRVLSVLPPHHIVVARSDQMVPDLSAAFEILRARYEKKWPSFISFITGPSRTGDIERILVLGAHGPKRLTVYILE